MRIVGALQSPLQGVLQCAMNPTMNSSRPEKDARAEMEAKVVDIQVKVNNKSRPRPQETRMLNSQP